MKKAAIITTSISSFLIFFGALPFILNLFLPKNTSSIGVIGGADGPTAMYVTSTIPFAFLFSTLIISGIMLLNVGIILFIINACKK